MKKKFQGQLGRHAPLTDWVRAGCTIENNSQFGTRERARLCTVVDNRKFMEKDIYKRESECLVFKECIMN